MPETEVKDVTAESNINEILSKTPDALAEQEATPAEPSTETEQPEGAEETPAEGEKPETETPEGEEEDTKDLKEGQPVPYVRFKQINDERKQLKTELEGLQEAQEKFDALLEDAEVLKVVRKKQGYTDEAIEAELKELGFEEVKKDKEETFDLTSAEGWTKFIENKIQQALSPVKKTLTESQRQEQEKALTSRLEKEKTEVEKVCKDAYGIKYGDETNAKDPTTGSGKIWLYLEKHPEKTRLASLGYLTKTDLLRLAIAEEGVKLGEKKGETKEKERQAKLKAVAMEGEAEAQGEEFPQANWPTQKIVEWKEKHPES